MSGSKAPAIPDVKAKSVGDLYGEAVNANISNLPALFKAYQQYGPQYAQVLAQQYGQLVPGIQNSYYGANPSLQPAQQYMAGKIQDISQAGFGGIPSDILVPFRESLRAAQAARGQAESPISADSEALQLGQFAESYKSNIFNENNQLINSNPINSAFLAATPQPVSPGSIGLAGASPSDLTTVGVSQNALDVNTQLTLAAARQAQYNKELANKQAIWGGVGAATGAVIGGVATGGNPMGISAGAKAGQTAGQGVGTFF